MKWDHNHDEMSMKEVVLNEPYAKKRWTKERGKIWSDIAAFLNNLNSGFNVDQRGVSDRYEKLKSEFIKKNRNELNASGIAPEPLSPVEILLEDVIEKENVFNEEREKEREEENKRKQADRQNAEEMRQRSMETVGETSVRDQDDDGRQGRKRKLNSSEMVSFFKAKAEKDHELKLRELELREREHKANVELQTENMKMMKNMIEANNAFQKTMMDCFQQYIS